MKKSQVWSVVAVLGLLVSGCSSRGSVRASEVRAANVIELPDSWSASRTCVLIQDLESGERWEVGGAFCEQRLSPCSTFKVPHALIGLKLGELSGVDHVGEYDGGDVPFDAWARDHDLASAIEFSVVWYFQALAERIGPERMSRELDALAYGNKDISSGQTAFWLSGGSLEISPREQLDFVARLFSDRLPFSREHQASVRELLVVRRAEEYTLSGKTGSGLSPGGGFGLGWFVGSYATGARELVFVAVSEEEGWSGRRVRGEVEALLSSRSW